MKNVTVIVPNKWWRRLEAATGRVDGLAGHLAGAFPGCGFSVLAPSYQSSILEILPMYGRADDQALRLEFLEQVRQSVLTFFGPHAAASEGEVQAPEILEEFMSEVRELYGTLVETDQAALMFQDHLRREAEADPNIISQTFIRGGQLSGSGWTYQYRTSMSELRRNNGRNRVLRNRSLILFLYVLWEDKYRPGIASALNVDKNEVASDLFGDLRLYRNAIAHARGRLSRATKVLDIVKVDETIDLVDLHGEAPTIDHLFRLIVDEINRLSAVYFHVAGSFSLDSPGDSIILMERHRWHG